MTTVKIVALWKNAGIIAPDSKLLIALVAQGIEHRIPNPGVARSIRAEGTNKNKGLIRVISWLSPFFI